jgi:hypothetical protein
VSVSKLITATPNAYANGNQLVLINTVLIDFQVYNAAVYLQRAAGDTVPNWSLIPETYYAPGKYSIVRAAAGVNFRSAVTGTPAVVSVELCLMEDLPEGWIG